MSIKILFQGMLLVIKLLLIKKIIKFPPLENI